MEEMGIMLLVQLGILMLVWVDHRLAGGKAEFQPIMVLWDREEMVIIMVAEAEAATMVAVAETKTLAVAAVLPMQVQAQQMLYILQGLILVMDLYLLPTKRFVLVTEFPLILLLILQRQHPLAMPHNRIVQVLRWQIW